ncbi:BgTH12-07319 [Blumeria graminis f. sp. triticale]|uniref:BgTH12-07319 n=1 Tax=Blumeria graminis f. sp. triticale TaxID=1689686 RepID=A0A9W4GIZ6_BLUGR|nr:BgTH12-07319 [Blumeria graminis f. sp. triticale]
MEFLKSAVVSAISKGPHLPYSFGDQINIDLGIWTLYNGTKRDDGSKCSIFSFEINAKKSLLPLARNAVKKFRTLRHPRVIKVLDTSETESYIYIVTERVLPLMFSIRGKSMSPETIKWGLFSVAQTFKFINDDAASIHGALQPSSIFTNESGEWKVGGFEVLSSVNDTEAIIHNYGSLVPNSKKYAPPELAKSSWNTIKNNPPTAVDAYNFGVLISEVFTGKFSGETQATQATNIPSDMIPGYRRLTNVNPKARISIGNFLDQGRRNGGFFSTRLIKLTEEVDQLGMKSEHEREIFLSRRDLEQLSDDFPEDYLKTKVLQELLKSIEFGGGGSKIWDVVVKISQNLSDDEFDLKISPAVVRLFNSSDRAIRVSLLDSLPHIIDRISYKIVNDKIFPQLVTGFTDTAPVVREQTVKSVLTIINKLSEKTINGELLRHLAKTANDEQPGIRTNTTICLGKISKNLGDRTRAKVLIAAFTRSLADPFVHARHAALTAMSVTSDIFSAEDCANRILPALCPCLIDKENLVREQAVKTIDIFFKKIRKFASALPDSALSPPATDSSTLAPHMGPSQSNETSSWTGWAISSFTNKVSGVAGEIISNNSPNMIPRPSSAPSNETGKTVAPNTNSSDFPTSKTRVNNLSSSTTPYNYSTENDTEEIDFDVWEQDDTFFDAPSESVRTPYVSASNPFEKEDEPDFAGWLAAQAGKKAGSKPLPKGLARSVTLGATVSTSRVKNTPTRNKNTKTQATTVPVATKIDTTPRDDDDEDGWGDGWNT